MVLYTTLENTYNPCSPRATWLQSPAWYCVTTENPGKKAQVRDFGQHVAESAETEFWDLEPNAPQWFPARWFNISSFQAAFPWKLLCDDCGSECCRMQTLFFEIARAKQQVKRRSPSLFHIHTNGDCLTAFPTQKWQCHSNASPEELKAGLKQVHVGQYLTQCYSKQPRDCMLSHRWASKHYSNHIEKDK